VSQDSESESMTDAVQTTDTSPPAEAGTNEPKPKE